MTDKRKRKPVSRVDSNNTHGWFARVYRAEWVGSRSFADRQYGGREKAKAAAWQWVKMADERLPVIPSKPVLRRSSVTMRFEEKLQSRLYYFDVYLPPLASGASTWTEKLYFHNLDEKKKQKAKADQLASERDRELREIYAHELAGWFVEHDRLMEQILAMWPNLKGTFSDGNE